MSWSSLLALSIALAMDAFAVSAVIAVALHGITRRHIFRVSFHFGLFQALMLIAGWLFGSELSALLSTSDHWIAFGLLAFIGGRMIWGAFRREEQAIASDQTRGWSLVLLSIATSLDALAVGLSLAIIHVAILGPAIMVGLVASVLSILGMAIGEKIGALWGKRVEVLGGCVLIAIGFRILWQHIAA
jgi:putative Mn2+ efflux pump MntP